MSLAAATASAQPSRLRVAFILLLVALFILFIGLSIWYYRKRSSFEPTLHATCATLKLGSCSASTGGSCIGVLTSPACKACTPGASDWDTHAEWTASVSEATALCKARTGCRHFQLSTNGQYALIDQEDACVPNTDPEYAFFRRIDTQLQQAAGYAGPFPNVLGFSLTTLSCTAAPIANEDHADLGVCAQRCINNANCVGFNFDSSCTSGTCCSLQSTECTTQATVGATAMFYRKS